MKLQKIFTQHNRKIIPRLCGAVLLLFAAFWLMRGGILAVENDWVIDGETTGTNPKDRGVSVNAVVPSPTPTPVVVTNPDTPILIAPTNNSTTRDNAPIFSWYGNLASDIDHYQISLDGEVWFDALPWSSSNHTITTHDYKFVYRASMNAYEFTPRAPLTDTLHTWKVKVFNKSGYSSDSATWSFTIDSQAPVFVITKIGATEVSISANDLSTIPTDPIILTANEPLIVGTGEASSQIDLLIQITGQGNQGNIAQNFPISADGTWIHRLPTLPRDTLIYLNFTITDLASNVTVLNRVPLKIVSQVVTIPGITGLVPQFPPPLDKLIPNIPSIEIPIVPPREIMIDTGQAVYDQLPPVAQQVIATAGTPITTVVSYPGLSSWLALLILILPAIMATFWLARGFGRKLAVTHLGEIWRALGLWPKFSPQGAVINAVTGYPIRFAKVNITGQTDRKEMVDLTKISNAHGVFAQVSLKPGRYQISVRHPRYTFPSLVKMDPGYSWLDWYQGQEFAVKTENKNIQVLPGVVIPLDAVKNKVTDLITPSEQLLMLAHLQGPLMLSHLSLCLVITMFFPSLWNLGAIAIYFFSLSKRAHFLKSGGLVSQVFNDSKQPLAYVGGLHHDKNNRVKDVFITDEFGKFERTVPFGSDDTLKLIKHGFRLPNNSIFELKSPMSQITVMQAIVKSYDDLR